MLDAMRRGALNWLSKILLALLVVAFAVWGVADVFRGYGRGTLARIGNTEISVDEYRQAYAVAERFRGHLSADEASVIEGALRRVRDENAG